MPDIECLANTGTTVPMLPILIAAMLVVAGIAVVAIRKRRDRKAMAAGAGALLALALLVPMLSLSPSTAATAATVGELCPSPTPPAPPCEPATTIAPSEISFGSRSAEDGHVSYIGLVDEAWLAQFLAAGGTFDSATFLGVRDGVVVARDLNGETLGSQPWSAQVTGTAVGPIAVTDATTLTIDRSDPENVTAVFAGAASASQSAAYAALEAQFPGADITFEPGQFISNWTVTGSYPNGCGTATVDLVGPIGGGGGNNGGGGNGGGGNGGHGNGGGGNGGGGNGGGNNGGGDNGGETDGGDTTGGDTSGGDTGDGGTGDETGGGDTGGDTGSGNSGSGVNS